MPHIIVRHSIDPTLDVPSLLRDLHEDLAAHESVSPAQIKTYALPLEHYIVGKGAGYKMVHVEIKMKHGRPEDVRKQMAAQMHDIIKNHAEKTGTPYGISVEVYQLDDPTYHSSYTEEK